MLHILLLISATIALSIMLIPLSSRFRAPILLVFLAIGMALGEDGPGGIEFEECQETVTAFSGQARDQFKKLLKEKTQVATDVKGTLKTMLTRLDNSVSG